MYSIQNMGTYLGGRVDGDEDHVGALDLRVDVGREEEVPAPALLDHLQQTGLVDGEIVGVPCIDLPPPPPPPKRER